MIKVKRMGGDIKVNGKQYMVYVDGRNRKLVEKQFVERNFDDECCIELLEEEWESLGDYRR